MRYNSILWFRNSSGIASNRLGIKQLAEIRPDLVAELFIAING